MTIHMEHPLFAEERQEEIVRLLRTKDRLTVPQLCEHFQVSAATIRNDIRKLAAEKKAEENLRWDHSFPESWLRSFGCLKS